MPNTLKKFCGLSKYIEQIDRDLFQVFEDLCALNYLKPKRDANGITFLYPKEKAYRTKIINAAYSTNPEVAINMLKALILQGHYADCNDFSGDVVNLLNQKLDIENASAKEVKLGNGLSLVKDMKFAPMGHRENMSVFILNGKGELSLTGPTGSIKNSPKSAVGGSIYSSDNKSSLHKLLERTYQMEDRLSNNSNVYMKKVYLQLSMIEKNGHADKLQHYLGNEEVSDSYLLDMLCSKYCSSCFDKLYKCLGSGGVCHQKVQNISANDYLNQKERFAPAGANNNSKPNLLSSIKSAMDVRVNLKQLYSNDTRLGKDLFIVFTNLCKELWASDASMHSNYAYLASKVYTDPKDLVHQEFDVARDLSLWGNLLKSDVLLYVPQARFDTPPAEYITLTHMPAPNELKLYSLNGIQYNRMIQKKGGNPLVENLINEHIQ